jgi:hypothetical protein
MKSIKTHKALVFGKGKWGKVFISRLKKEVQIKKIFRSKDNYKKVSLENIDWIFILTSTNKHYEICNYFLGKCKNIFCEKPLTSSYNSSKKLLEKAKKMKTNLYVSDIENFKNKKIKIEKENIILREKFTNDKKDILSRYAYHDLYILSNFINLKKFKKLKLINNSSGNLEYSFWVNKNFFKFNYSFNSKKKVHKINNKNFLSFKKNPLDKMIKKIVYKKINFKMNNQSALLVLFILNKLKKLSL